MAEEKPRDQPPARQVVVGPAPERPQELPDLPLRMVVKTGADWRELRENKDQPTRRDLVNDSCKKVEGD
jgi:hypothetical protein